MPRPKTKPAAAAPPNPFDMKREVVYPVLATFNHVGKDALTTSKAKEILGWSEVIDAKESMLTDHHGNRIQLLYNQHNRIIDESWCKTLAQVILKKQWKWNYIPICISKFGNVVTGQHRLIAFIFAEQIRMDPKHRDYWIEQGWPKSKEITIDVTVVTGTSEDASLTSSFDYTRPTTSADVLYKDQAFFRKSLKTQQERAKLCNVAGSAINKLWIRTGRKNDAHVPVLTHTEAVEFLRDHPSLEEAVQSIVLNNEGGKIGWYTNTGMATALLYLMAASTSDPAAYKAERKESSLDLFHPMGKVANATETILDVATGFWTALSTKSDRVLAVRKWITKRQDDANKAGEIVSDDEVVSAIVKGWNRFMRLSATGKLTEGDVKLTYVHDDKTNETILKEFSRCNDGRGNGIDVTTGKIAEEPLSTEPEADDPAPDEVASTAEEIREETVKANGGASEDESPAAEKARREELEARAAAPPPPNGKPPLTTPFTAKKPAPKPKLLSPEDANRAAVAQKPKPKPDPSAA